MELNFRRAEVADASRLASFAAQTFTATYAAHNTAEDMRNYLAGTFGPGLQLRELSDPEMITVLAESGGTLVGYAQVRRKGAPSCVPQDSVAEIYRFYVDGAAHGKGVAQRLMEGSLVAARDLSAARVWLGVWERNARAIAFYRKCRFQEVGTQYFQLGNDRQRDLVLTRPLGATCDECGAFIEPGRKCRDYLDELLALEWQVPGGPGDRAHFLAVGSYNLQHPSALTPSALKGLRQTFADVLAGRATVADALARARSAADGSTRVRRRPQDAANEIAGWPTQWAMTVRDVCDAPVSRYLEQVQAWAMSVDRQTPRFAREDTEKK